MTRAVFMLSGVILIATIGTAGEAHATSPAFAKCMEKAGVFTFFRRRCAADEQGRQDRELNALYKQAMARKDAPGRDQLQMQERAWLATLKECDELLQRDGFR